MSVTDKSKKPKSYHFNTFFALQIKNPEVLENLKRLREKVCAIKPEMKEVMPEPGRFHISIQVFHLNDDNKLQILMERLEKVAADQNEFDLKIKNVLSFPKRALYAGIEDDKVVQNIWEKLKCVLKKEDLDISKEKRPFIPHVTLFVDTKKSPVIDFDPKIYDEISNFDFGTETISSIQLLRREKIDGYYKILHEVNLGTQAGTS